MIPEENLVPKRKGEQTSEETAVSTSQGGNRCYGKVAEGEYKKKVRGVSELKE
jgi:hypothetical protein